MATIRPRAARIALPSAAALLFAGSVVGIVTVRPDEPFRGSSLQRDELALDGVVAPSTSAGPTTSAPAPAPGPDAPSTSAAGAAPPATSAVPAASPDAPGPPQAPAPGSYRYHQTTTTPEGKTLEDDHTQIATRVGEDADGIVQRLSLPMSTGSGEASVVATVAWGSKGVLVRSWDVRLYGGTFACDWQPDIVEYPAQLAVGTSWNVDATCTGQVQGGQLDGSDATMRMKGTRKVTGTKVEQVGARSVPTWTITQATDMQLSSGGLAGVTRTEGTEQLAPSLGVATSAVGSETVDSFGAKKTSRTVLTLTSLP